MALVALQGLGCVAVPACHLSSLRLSFCLPGFLTSWPLTDALATRARCGRGLRSIPCRAGCFSCGEGQCVFADGEQRSWDRRGSQASLLGELGELDRSQEDCLPVSSMVLEPAAEVEMCVLGSREGPSSHWAMVGSLGWGEWPCQLGGGPPT